MKIETKIEKEFLFSDKKSNKENIDFVVLKKIGEPFIVKINKYELVKNFDVLLKNNVFNSEK